MPITNPNLMGSFDENQTNTSEPPSTQQTDGYAANEIPQSYHHGYMFNQWYSNLNFIKKNGFYQWSDTVSYNQFSITMRNGRLKISAVDSNLNNDPITPDITKWKDFLGNEALPFTFASDAEDTLTDYENLFSRIEIQDGVITDARNLIVSNIERDFIVINNNTYDVVIKTSAGTGKKVFSGESVKLKCDGTNVISNQLDRLTGTATFTNSTQNINMTGIGDLKDLEIGDVIKITDSLSNNKLFTVEFITDSNNVIVNYEHRGQTTIKALVDETSTANVTVSLFCKYYNATLGLGQGKCIPASGRISGVPETNSTNRTIVFSGNFKTASSGNFSLDIDNVLNVIEIEVGGSGDNTPFYSEITPDSDYAFTSDQSQDIFELR